MKISLLLSAFLLLVGCCGDKQEKSMSITVNLRYEYYQSLDDPETILLIDSWANQEAIDKHHATPMMDTIAKLREKYDLHMTVERYTAAETPESENKFIRK